MKRSRATALPQYFPARCETCRRRRTLDKHPDKYERGPYCGCKYWDKKTETFKRSKMILDSHRVAQSRLPGDQRTDPGKNCRCGGSHRAYELKQIIYFGGRTGDAPHRLGSPGCIHFKEDFNSFSQRTLDAIVAAYGMTYEQLTAEVPF